MLEMIEEYMCSIHRQALSSNKGADGTSHVWGWYHLVVGCQPSPLSSLLFQLNMYTAHAKVSL